LKWLASWISEPAARIACVSGLAHAASAPQAAGQIRPSSRALAPIAAGDRRDRAVEAELAEHCEAVERVGRNGADRRHQPERDGQVVVAAFLGQVGGGEIDGDAARRQREAGGGQRRAHPLARFRHRLVGQPDHEERRQSGRHLDLHVDRAGLDALERHGGYPLDHSISRHNGPCGLQSRVAESGQSIKNVWRTFERRTDSPCAPNSHCVSATRWPRRAAALCR
jgi:hypothetical protein